MPCYPQKLKGEALRLHLMDRFADASDIGYEWVEPLSFGYDASGQLMSMLCRVPFSSSHVGLTVLGEDDLFGDLFEYYEDRRAGGSRFDPVRGRAVEDVV